MSSADQDAGDLPPVLSYGEVELAGIRVNFRRAGNGTAVIILEEGDPVQPSRLGELLAAGFQTLAAIISSADLRAAAQSQCWARELPRVLAQAAGVGDLEHFALVSTAGCAPLALQLILDQPERVDAVVLIAPHPVFPELHGSASWPEHAALAGKLAEINAPTLLLLGTEDQVIPPETGGMYAERLPNCYYVLVYDAGHFIESEQPQKLSAIIRDFLERRENFVVNRASTVLINDH
jgi:pimeloyl-ACP methyl ester carboxylesterase